MENCLKLAALLSAVFFAPVSAAAAPISVEGGQVVGTQAGDLRAFKGIPYAAPPVGPLRWRPPQSVTPWHGVRHTATYGPACPQIGNYPADASQELTREDCLTLNVWTPARSSTARLPVMVWFHGGGLVNGSGSVPQYAGDRLATRGVVVVTINYRLGVLGFLAHPELNKESPRHTSGNYGLLDQIAALNWVRRNIQMFGGDPDQVTIFGQSSGSFSVSMLVASPLAKGLFHRAIGQSGGVFEPVELDPRFTPEGAAESGIAFANRAGLSSLAQLRRIPVEALLKTRFEPQFNIDGYAIPMAPHDAYEAGKQNDVDLLIGSNAAEGSFFFDPKTVTVANFHSVLARTYPGALLWAVGASPGNSDAEARKAAVSIDTDIRFGWGMWAWARLAAKNGRRRVFLYRFTAQPAYRPGHPLHGLGPTHGGELPYVFGYLNPQSADWTAEDRALADKMQQYWVNFAKTGDPNGAGLPAWPQFDHHRPTAMQLGDTVHASALTGDTRLKRIDRIYGVARYVNRHAYGLLAIGGLFAIFLMTILVRYLLRLFARRSAIRSTLSLANPPPSAPPAAP